MTLNLRTNYQVVLLLLFMQQSLCLFFNKTSFLEISPFDISQGFQLTFRTCKGGQLLKQDGTNQTYFELFIVHASMNYTTQHFTPSVLGFKWKSLSGENIAYVGKDLDQNIPYDVVFKSGITNSTLSVSIGSVKHSVLVSSSVLSIQSNGNMVLGNGFVGCIQFGNNFNIKDSIEKNKTVSEGCPLDSQQGCKKRACPVGFKGYYCEVNIDDCATQPCHHASTCVDGVNNYTCVCGISWYGRHCNQLKVKKPCDYTPCANGGICTHISDYNNYTCACKEPYSGRNCTEIMDPCQSNPCHNNGSCKNVTSTYYTCSCLTGFSGQNCEVNTDDCAKADCGSGKCVDGIANHSCNCTGTGFTGTKCQHDIDECNQSPCKNSVTCINYAGGYKCTCLNGYAGKNCQDDIDECATSPCQNEGNCTDLVGDYSCHCPAEFSGKSCESKLHICNLNQNFSTCSPNPCQHGQCQSICHPYSAAYNCSCNHGFRGVNCSEDINECGNATFCFNNTKCINTPGDFHCKCPFEYVGKYCNISRSICHPNPCLHGTCFNVTETSYNCSCYEGWRGFNCTQDIDECSNKLDKCNKTQTNMCENSIGGYKCVCKTGYTGTYCNDDVNECLGKPCLNDGLCQNLPGTYICYCSGYFGKHCENKIDYCSQEEDTICNNGTCVNLKLDYRCDCFTGWEGRHCSNDIDECGLKYCMNNATCNNTLGDYNCFCKPGYMDKNCSTDIDECASTPCKNNGTCTDLVNNYLCNCSAGYEGKSCETDVDWCDPTRYNGSKPCLYGVCHDRLLNHTCDCFDGYTGIKCEKDVDECTTDMPCKHGATCVEKSNNTAVEKYFGKDRIYSRNESGGYLCICQPGYNGTNCENDIDECLLYSPCNITGTHACIDLINDYNCTCKPGYKGRNCSEDINECASNPCFNNASCLDLEARFQCICGANHTGARCDSELDPCTANAPCKNGATCTVTSDLNFTCSCAEGYAGATCTNKTTLAFVGTSTMSLTVLQVSYNVSFSFQTIFSDGILVTQPSKWFIALQSGSLQFLWQGSLLFTLGSDFADSRWHSVTMVLTEKSVSLQVSPETCSQQCSGNKMFQPLAASALSTGTRLVVGGTPGASDRPNFTGSIQDFSVDDVKYYPGVSGVSVSDVIANFQRQNVCVPSPCVNGRCRDHWSYYTCECYRNWTSTNCSEEVIWGTFGAISRLNNGYNSTSNQSYAKYSFSAAMNFQSLSFFIRTRSQSSVIIRLYKNTSTYFSIETFQGFLQLRHNSDVIKTTTLLIADSFMHYISINRSTVHVDGSSRDVNLPMLSIKDVHVGGFRGCIRDTRLNNEQLLFFNQSLPKFNVIQKNVAKGCSSEDVCRKLSGAPRCINNGNCTDLWNKYQCSCPWPHGGDNCELYGCQWRNFCPGNATCMNAKNKAEFECLTEVTFNGSQSSAIFTNSTPLSTIQSLVLQFRTLQNDSSLLTSGNNSTFFEIVVEGGRLVVLYNFQGNQTGVVHTDFPVSNGKWHELRIESTSSNTNFTVVEIKIEESQTRYFSSNNLLRNISILNDAFTSSLSTSGVRLGLSLNNSRNNLIGCFRLARVGEHLLSFIKNLTMTTRPGFNHAKSAFLNGHLSNVIAGCHSNRMCTSSLCGTGKCVELWNDFSCDCPVGYHGDRCEFNPCSSSPCIHGNCTIASNDYACLCDTDYVGKTCNESCASYLCENGGKCRIEKGKLQCECTAEWTGEHCGKARPRDDDDDDDNLALIIGLSVAGGVLLLIIIVIIFCCTRNTSSTFGTYSPRNEEKVGANVEMNTIDLPQPEKLI